MVNGILMIPPKRKSLHSNKSNVISLRKRIEARYPALKWLMYQRLVVFTHTNLIDKPSAEFDRWELLQQEDFNKKDFNIVESLRRVLIKCSDNLKETKVGKNVGIKELDKSSMNLIVDFLRPDYEHYVSPRDRVNNIEKEIKNYTTEQFKTLIDIRNPSCVCSWFCRNGKNLYGD